jgi:hypothetical protein
MRESEAAQGQLVRVQKRLARWRAQHGGRGRPIPAALWAEAAAVASTAGVEATARALAVNRARLTRQVEGPQARSAGRRTGPLRSPASFVELDARRVFSRGQMLVRVTNREGEQLEIAVEGGASDVVTVARAFWDRGAR